MANMRVVIDAPTDRLSEGIAHMTRRAAESVFGSDVPKKAFMTAATHFAWLKEVPPTQRVGDHQPAFAGLPVQLDSEMRRGRIELRSNTGAVLAVLHIGERE